MVQWCFFDVCLSSMRCLVAGNVLTLCLFLPANVSKSTCHSGVSSRKPFFARRVSQVSLHDAGIYSKMSLYKDGFVQPSFYTTPAFTQATGYARTYVATECGRLLNIGILGEEASLTVHVCTRHSFVLSFQPPLCHGIETTVAPSHLKYWYIKWGRCLAHESEAAPHTKLIFTTNMATPLASTQAISWN